MAGQFRMDFDEEGPSEYEVVRARNMRELEELMSSIDAGDAAETINGYGRRRPERRKRRRRDDRPDDDAAPFRYRGAVPAETRRSARLSGGVPTYAEGDDDDDDDGNAKPRPDAASDIGALEAIVFRRPRPARRPAASAPPVTVPVEAITAAYLSNVARRSVAKVHSSSGTSCHQCRQKTADSKTYCRSGTCVGARGRFCGVCLRNRYGEEAADALVDPRWRCPPCRGLCNCSVCRARDGKRPTGILAPAAFRRGHRSVRELLASLGAPPRCAEEDCEHLELVGFAAGSTAALRYDGGGLCCGEDRDLLGFDGELRPVLVG